MVMQHLAGLFLRDEDDATLRWVIQDVAFTADS